MSDEIHRDLKRVGTWAKSELEEMEDWSADFRADQAEEEELADGSASRGFGACADVVGSESDGLRSQTVGFELLSAPRVGNTGGMFSQSTLGDKLHAPQRYLPPPVTFTNFVERHDPHWSQTDPELFAKLPQGGGGIDWLTSSVYGSLTRKGRAICASLKAVKEKMGERSHEKLAEFCAEHNLGLFSAAYRESMTFYHPADADEFLKLSHGVDGTGRSFFPLIVHVQGIKVKYGRISDSVVDGKTVGPMASIEIPGLVFLRLGEFGAFKLAEKVCRDLGIKVDGLRASRMDACCDLVNITVDEFAESYKRGQMIKGGRKCQGMVFHYGPPERDGTVKCQTMSLKTAAVGLTVYDKLAELAYSDKTGEKLPLMIANRWGGLVKSATRVEFRFKLGKSKAKRYDSFRELLESLADLLGWVLNTWVRFAHVEEVSDRSHTPRAKYCDHWLRTLHAFAFWAHRMGKRPAPKQVQAAPPMALLKQAAGCLSSFFGSVGMIPKDDMTVWTYLNHWIGPVEIASQCRKKAVEALTTRGTVLADIRLDE